MPRRSPIDRPWHTFSEMLEVANVMYQGKIETLENLALKLGHQTVKSGGFNMKIASLSKFGLADRQKGQVKLTPLAKKILLPVGGDKEKYEACREAILGVPLLKRLYERLDGEEVRQDDLWSHLYEVSGDREASVKEAAPVYRIYTDALTYLRKAEQVSPSIPESPGPVASQESTKPPIERNPSVDGSLVRVQSGDLLIQLPRTKENIEIIVSALKAMALEKQIQNPPSKKEDTG